MDDSRSNSFPLSFSISPESGRRQLNRTVVVVLNRRFRPFKCISGTQPLRPRYQQVWNGAPSHALTSSVCRTKATQSSMVHASHRTGRRTLVRSCRAGEDIMAQFCAAHTNDAPFGFCSMDVLLWYRSKIQALGRSHMPRNKNRVPNGAKCSHLLCFSTLF